MSILVCTPHQQASTCISLLLHETFLLIALKADVRVLKLGALAGGSKPWLSKEESESAYQAMKRFCSGPMSLDPKSIVLKDKIGMQAVACF